MIFGIIIKMSFLAIKFNSYRLLIFEDFNTFKHGIEYKKYKQ